MASSTCVARFGIIGDVQYADVEDGSDFLHTELRFFRNALQILKATANNWSKEGANFVVQIGDLIDGCNKKGNASRKALSMVLEAFPPGIPRCDVVGNHELYNFDFDELASLGFRTRGEDLQSSMEPAPENLAAYSFTADPDTSLWEIIVLDSYDMAVIGYPEDHPKTIGGKKVLLENNPNALAVGVDWFDGLPEERHRWVQYNGGIGKKQLDWFRDVLHTVTAHGRKAIVITHVPAFEPTSTVSTILWNSEDLLEVLHSEDGECVVAMIAGHDHTGGYGVDSHGIHHVTLTAPLISAPGSGSTGSGMVELYPDRAELVGYGLVCNGYHKISLKRDRKPAGS